MFRPAIHLVLLLAMLDLPLTLLWEFATNVLRLSTMILQKESVLHAPKVQIVVHLTESRFKSVAVPPSIPLTPCTYSVTPVPKPSTTAQALVARLVPLVLLPATFLMDFLPSMAPIKVRVGILSTKLATSHAPVLNIMTLLPSPVLTAPHVLHPAQTMVALLL